MILVVDMNCKRDSLGYYEFVMPIVEVVKPLGDCVVKHYLDITAQDLSLCGTVILSGTPLKDTATLKQPEKFRWLKETDRPVLGVCAGMETIGVVYGAEVRRCVEIGMTQISTVQDNQLFQGDFRAYSLHSVCVDLGGEFEVLAKSAQCIQAFKLRDRRIYGTLFHPEVRNPEIIKKFLQFQDRAK